MLLADEWKKQKAKERAEREIKIETIKIEDSTV
jgi:hypothetical protein